VGLHLHILECAFVLLVILLIGTNIYIGHVEQGEKFLSQPHRVLDRQLSLDCFSACEVCLAHGELVVFGVEFHDLGRNLADDGVVVKLVISSVCHLLLQLILRFLFDLVSRFYVRKLAIV